MWGRDGFNALWAAATIKLIGAGIDDAAHLEEISRLVGEHDITTRSTTHTRCARGNSGGSETLALRRQRVLPPETLRALPKGQALLLATGARAALINLRPWYHDSNAKQITAGTTANTTELTRRANPNKQ